MNKLLASPNGINPLVLAFSVIEYGVLCNNHTGINDTLLLSFQEATNAFNKGNKAEFDAQFKILAGTIFSALDSSHKWTLGSMKSISSTYDVDPILPKIVKWTQGLADRLYRAYEFNSDRHPYLKNDELDRYSYLVNDEPWERLLNNHIENVLTSTAESHARSLVLLLSEDIDDRAFIAKFHELIDRFNEETRNDCKVVDPVWYRDNNVVATKNEEYYDQFLGDSTYFENGPMVEGGEAGIAFQGIMQLSSNYLQQGIPIILQQMLVMKLRMAHKSVGTDPAVEGIVGKIASIEGVIAGEVPETSEPGKLQGPAASGGEGSQPGYQAQPSASADSSGQEGGQARATNSQAPANNQSSTESKKPGLGNISLRGGAVFLGAIAGFDGLRRAFSSEKTLKEKIVGVLEAAVGIGLGAAALLISTKTAQDNIDKVFGSGKGR